MLITKSCQLTLTKWLVLIFLGAAMLVVAQNTNAAKPVNPICEITSITFPNPADDATADQACLDANVCVYTGGEVSYTGRVSDASPPYSIAWEFNGGNPFQVGDTIASSGGTSARSTVYNASGNYSTLFTASDSAGKPRSCSVIRSVRVISQETGGTGETSINSTSANGNNPPADPVPEPPLAFTRDFTVIGINDLGMHCADLDSRVMSILPPFNVVHAVAIKKGVGETQNPLILDDTQVEIVYSAASNSLDPVFDPASPPELSILGNGDVYKTNFWTLNPRGTGNILGFDLYDAFYPDGVLDAYNSVNSVDIGLPVPDLFELYLGGGTLVADLAKMPGLADPYVANDPQHFDRVDTTLPFFINFPVGYTLTEMNWFAADGIPISYVDDRGRENAYPLMRVQAKAAPGNTLGFAAGTTLASVDTVLPVAIEADCKTCHTSSVDGGNGEAACFPGLDADCAVEGSKRSSTPYTVVSPSDDPDPNTTLLISEEWAADTNVVRLHDAKHGTTLEANTPIACQSCHYTPALDLAQLGPTDDIPRGREQTNHKSFSNVMHKHHGQFTDLFPAMPAPGEASQQERLAILEQTCYGCHPGKRTQCLRGAMFQGGMLCQDCHGDMIPVGNDFTDNFPVIAYPDGVDLTTRVPWASEPGCQSCHVGDAVNQPADKSGFIYADDGIRLLRAWRTGDADAKPITSPTSRFAEDLSVEGNTILYRLSKGGDPIENGEGKKGHGGVFCEACHGSTHAIWPVTPRSGPFVANDNTTATQLQGHDGKIQECDVCHQRDVDGNLTMPLSLNGPHGMHPVNDSRWNLNHRNFTGSKQVNCKVCHGGDLTGSVLSKTSADRVLLCKNTAGDFPDCAAGLPTANVPAGTQIGCGNCHKQK